MNKVECIGDDDLRPEYPGWQILGGVRGARYPRKFDHELTVRIEVSSLQEGRWRARSSEFPDAIGYGENADSALDRAEARIVELINKRVASGDLPPTGLSFAIDYQ